MFNVTGVNIYPTADLRCVLTRTRNNAVTVTTATLVSPSEVHCDSPPLPGGTYTLEILFDVALNVRYMAPFLLDIIGTFTYSLS